MRWALAVIGVGLAVALFALTNPPEPVASSTTFFAAPASTTTTVAATTTTRSAGSSHPSWIEGALPDGTPYTVIYEGHVAESVEGIQGAVVIDVEGTPMAVGILDFQGTWTEEPVYEGGLYRPGGSTVSIAFYDHVLSVLGVDAEETITSSIRAGNARGFPTLEVDPPFRWASDNEIPVQMEVEYSDFVVRRGCDTQIALACSWNGGVQLIPEAIRFPQPAFGLVRPNLSIVSYPGNRPLWSDNYLDPGPLTARVFADVMWSGTEMLVWGGSDQEVAPNVADGAAFDPNSNTWRMLPPAPELHPKAATRAVLANDQMIVVARDVTLSHHLPSGEWSVLGEGRVPPQQPGKLVWNGESVFMWSDALWRLDVVSGDWTALDEPPMEIGPEPWMRSLHALGDVVLAAGSTGPCDGRAVVVWTPPGWQALDGLDLGTELLADCSTPRQTAVVDDLVLTWNPDSGRTLLWEHDADLEWLDMARPPLHGSEGAGGALVMDDRILVTESGEGHIYFPIVDAWFSSVLPGQGTEWDMVWTGEEVLMWGVPLCCLDRGARVDAWRWTPPYDEIRVFLSQVSSAVR